MRVGQMCNLDRRALDSRVGAAEAEAVVDLLQHRQQQLQLLGGVGRGDLDAEADLAAGDHR